MVCKNCGQEIPNGAGFCPKCGCKVEVESPVVNIIKKLKSFVIKQPYITAAIAGVLVIAIVLGVLFGTGAFEKDDYEDYDDYYSYESDYEDDDENAESIVSEDLDTVVEPIIDRRYSIREVLTDFSEGRAWVTYYTNNSSTSSNEYEYGVIDENGYLITAFSDYISKLNITPVCEATSFKDGVSCFYSSVTVHYGLRKSGMIVFDKNGKVIFSSYEMDENKSYYYLGYDNGSILAVEHIADFSTNEWNLCEMNTQGNITTRTAYILSWDENGASSDNFAYRGENIFSGACEKGDLVYNKSTKETVFIDAESLIEAGYHFRSDVVDGYVIISLTYDKTLYRIPITCLSSQEAWDSMKLKDYKMKATGTVSEGLIIDKTGIYDYRDNELATFSGDWDVQSVSAFKNGYAFISLKGADGETYCTCVDKEGKQQFAPVKSDEIYEEYVIYTVEGEKKAMDSKGQSISLDKIDEMKEKDTYGKMTSYNSKYERYEGIKNTAGETITSVCVVSNYDEIVSDN